MCRPHRPESGPYGVPAAAAALGVSPRALKAMIVAGVLPRADLGQGPFYALWSFTESWVAEAANTLRADPTLPRTPYFRREIVVKPGPGVIREIPEPSQAPAPATKE